MTLSPEHGPGLQTATSSFRAGVILTKKALLGVTPYFICSRSTFEMCKKL